jgi:hypothetical protein
MDVSLVSVLCCQVEVSATSWSLVQRSPTECGVSKNVIVKPRKKIRRPRPPRGCRVIVKKKVDFSLEQAMKPQRGIRSIALLFL